MFSFLDRDKSRRQKEMDNNEKEAPVVAPGTEITYKKSLISKYHEDHKNLRKLFNQTLMAYQQARDDAFLENLHNLQLALHTHMLDEELNLYIYLRHCYSHDKKNIELITRFKKSSKKTGATTFAYIKQFTEAGAAITRDDDFITQLLQIGNMLETLMAAEERHIYPIYKTPASILEVSV